MSAECSICTFSYDEAENKPLILPCGHTFCKKCLLQMDGESNTCAMCKKSWQSLNIESLPVCFQLIGTNKCKVAQLEVCEQHQDDISLWCNSCKVPICHECFTETHRDCEAVSISKKGRKNKIELNVKLLEIRKMIVDKNVSLTDLKNLIAETKALHDSLIKHEESVIAFINELQHDAALLSMQVDNNSSMLELSDEAKSLLSKRVPVQPSLPSCLANGDGGIDLFINKLRNYAEICVGQATNGEAANLVYLSQTHLRDCQPWIIDNQGTADAAIKTLETTERRPDHFIISGKDWIEPPFLDFLLKPIFYKYPISFKPSDCIYRPTNISVHTTDERIGALLAGNNSGNLTTVWGHLSPATLDKLPATVTSLGLVLHSAADVQTLGALITAIWVSMEHKWFCPNKLHLVVSKQLTTEELKINWQAETTASTVKWNGARCDNPLEWLCTRQYYHNGDYYTHRFATTLSIHVPDVTPDCNKAFKIVDNIANNCSDPTFIKHLYLPYTTADEMVFLGQLRDRKMHFTVHFPSSRAPPAGDDRLKQFTDAYKKYSRVLEYDAESN